MNSNKRIAHIVCTYPPYKGGMGKVAMEDALQAVKYGYQVSVFTPRYKYLRHLPKSQKKQQLKIYRLKPWFEFGNAAFLPQLLWRLRHYDILHIHYPFYGAMFFIAAAKFIFGARLVIHYHMDNYANGLKGFIFRLYRYLILPQVLNLADKIVVHSKDYAFNCNASWQMSHFASKIVSIPNGVDTDFYKPTTESKNKFNASTKQLLFVGALDKAHYFKGLDVLMRALKQTRIQNWQLHIVGNGDLVDYYTQVAKQNRIEGKLKFHHDCDDDCLRKLYNQAYVTILPSTTRGEAFGIVLIESMACKTPVIASNLPGVRSVVKHEDTGLLAHPRDVESLRTKIDFLLDHPQLAQQMGESGYQIVHTKYSWDSIGRQLNQLYETL